MRSASRLTVLLCLGVVALAVTAALPSPARAQLVISQLFGGSTSTGGNPGAANGDFIEIFNRSCVPVNLDAYSVQVASGGSGTVWSAIQLPNFQLDPGKYYCIRLTTTSVGTPFTADLTQSGLPGTPSGDLMLSSSGKAAIVFGNAALPTGSCPAAASVIDFARYDSTATACTEGLSFGVSLGGTSAGRSVSRKLDVNGDGQGDGCQDTNVNNNDFMSDLDPCVPRTNATPANVCPGAPVFGGCNLGDGSCRVTPNAAACSTLGGSYLGDCTPCVAPQACCLPTAPTGSCVVVSEAQCLTSGGVFNAGQFACPPSPACPALGRCCSPDGTCVQTFQVFCVSPNVYGGNGTNCAGSPCQGRCCDINGECTLTGSVNCVAPSVFAGIGTTCVGTPCQGRCCAPNGDCAMTSEINCTGANIFAGLGTDCSNPNSCFGACCAFNGGECTLQGPGTCPAPDVFAGVGSTCLTVQCSGRCCQANGTCTVTSVGACTGTFSIGQTCDPVEIRSFNGVNLLVPIGGVGGGYGPVATNVQTVSGITGSITDLDVDVKVQHTWAGDVKIDIEHLGTIVTIIDLIGHPLPDAGGCGTDDLDVIIDDEGAGGPIETQCLLTPPAALSPPNFTPESAIGTPYTTGGLSAFDGLDPNGDWTLSVSDGFDADSGTVLSWSLHIGHVGQACPTSGCTCRGDLNGDGVVNGKDVKPFANCVAAGGAGCPCGDMNHAGGATSADVSAFVTACLTGTCGP